jgi:N-acetylglucosaminyl-diphospho-decaprenol L-rhamnosyltransferase
MGEGPTDAAPALSVITVTYNSQDVIAGCVASLRAALPIHEVIVVDNGSEDATCERARSAGATVIANPDNVGYGRACNQGAQAATGSHLLFVNPDVEPTAVDVDGLLAALRARPFGLVGPQLSSGRHAVSGVYRHRHWTEDMLDHLAGPLVPRELPRLPRRPVSPARSWLSGAVLLAAADEFRAVGGFDERFFLYYEDRDLSRRYRAAGLPIGLTDALVFRHQLAGSTGGESSGLAARTGWSYLSWLQYLYIWHGRRTAERAARSARLVSRQIDALLGGLERGGPLAARAREKRAQLRGTAAFVSQQASRGESAAADGYCPDARRIAAEV